VVAVGIPGAAGVREVGMFHSGGPMPGNPEFLMPTRAGRMLDPERVLVASASNFGAPLADATQAPGSVLSIDPRTAAPLAIPDRFAAAGPAERGGERRDQALRRAEPRLPEPDP
jgi:hypothetical protein